MLKGTVKKLEVLLFSENAGKLKEPSVSTLTSADDCYYEVWWNNPIPEKASCSGKVVEADESTFLS